MALLQCNKEATGPSLPGVGFYKMYHQKNVKRRFEVNKLPNVTSSSAGHEWALIGTECCFFFVQWELSPGTIL